MMRCVKTDASADPALRAAIAALLREAQAAWPTLQLPPEQFYAYLAQRVSAPADLVALRAADLYLACGCAGGHPEALRLFEREVLGEVPQALRAQQLPPALVDEVSQQLRARLLLAEPGAAPKIVDYSGRGTLKGWVRVSAVRAGRDLLRRQTARSGAEQAAGADAPPIAREPEDAYARERYQEGFRAALAAALAALPAAQRELLELHFLDGLKLDEIAQRQGVNKSTISRRIAAACDAVFAAAQTEMERHLGLRPGEFESLAGVLRSQLHLSLSRVLRLPLTRPRASD